MEIRGIGVDTQENEAFNGCDKRAGFLSKLFTENEIEYCSSKKDFERRICARFAGKEAVIKAFGCLGERVLPDEIEILNDGTGCPRVTLHRKSLSKYKVFISLSHSKSHAIAFAVVGE